MDFMDKFKREDTYSLMCVLLYASSDDPKYALLNELAYLTDSKSFSNIIKYYGGQTITIPTLEECQRALQILLVHYYYRTEGYEYEKALELAGVPSSERRSVASQLSRFEKKLDEKDYQSGGIHNVFKALKS